MHLPGKKYGNQKIKNNERDKRRESSK